MVLRYIDENKEDRILVKDVVLSTSFIEPIVNGYTSNASYWKDNSGNLIICDDNIEIKIDKEDIYGIKTALVNTPLVYLQDLGLCASIDNDSIELFNSNNHQYLRANRDKLVESISSLVRSGTDA